MCNLVSINAPKSQYSYSTGRISDASNGKGPLPEKGIISTRAQDHTDADSAWVRQMETWGSQGFGGSFLPRVGDEVAVEFLGGDPDKPVITGSLWPGPNFRSAQNAKVGLKKRLLMACRP